MSANTETTGGPPKGYFLCPDCKTTWAGVGLSCWSCRLKLNPRRQFSESDTFKAYPDWTPPIAVPAAHVERRKGQRWRCQDEPGDVGTVGELIERSDTCWEVMVDGRRELWADCPNGSRWRDCIMTLLADATHEPATVRCAQHGAVASLCIQCKALGKSPPAQEAPKLLNAVVKAMDAHYRRPGIEAPKAAPVCRVRYSASGCFGEVADRIMTKAGKAVPCCETCLVAQDGQFARSKDIHQTGKPYAGPERLPKPQLAADWVEDCLPTVWR